MTMPFKLGLIALLALAVLVGTVAGRSQPKSSAALLPTLVPTPIPTPSPGHVVIADTGNPAQPARYVPSTIAVSLGQTVTWTNESSGVHSVTANNGTFDSGALSAGATFQWTPKKSGVYPYADIFFPNINGVVIVHP